jgi:16S rRNA (adenine1518-N6/adenine1519-N6)-dimethyltransferase
MTPPETRHRHKKRFGQHFLANAEIADRIAGLGELHPEDRVLEIGPGRGILTDRLLARTPYVTAVEIDRDLIAGLRERFGGNPGFRLVESDILAVDLEELFRDSPGKIKVVSNIPYNISGPIVEMLIRHRRIISRAVLMVQKEVALRLTASPGTKDYGLPTVNLGLCARTARMMDVKPGSFDPPPEVMSSVVRIDFEDACRYPLRDEGIFRELTGAAFRQRRKMVRNTIIPYMVSRGVPEAEAAPLLEEAGVRPDLRPEDIGVAEFARLSDLVAERAGKSGSRGGAEK